MIGEDILYLSVRELGRRIKSRELSPVELTEAYLQRSETLGAKLNAYTTITRELALQQARNAERLLDQGRYLGPLHGIPYAAKDLLAVHGYPTTWGARPYAKQMFDEDATVIRRLTDAGAILLGKAAMIELAGGMGYRYGTASISGGAKNPWNETCWTCGSSSGSGAATAAALAAFTIGTETWGSIICPSAYCGISGLRPTFGRVSRAGAMALSYSMDKIGPMCRTADDCGLVLSVIAGHDAADRDSLPDDAASFHHERVIDAPPRTLRIGWLTNQWPTITPEIDRLTRNALMALQANGRFTSKDIALPDGPWEPAAGVVISVEGASAFDDLIESGRVAELTDPLSRIGGYINKSINAGDYMRALRIRSVLQDRMNELFRNVDILATASLPIVATSMETNLETDLAFSDPIGGIGNFLGLPAISVPSGFTSKNLPTGIQFIAPQFGERDILTAAQLFQAHTDWHLKRPPV